MSPIEPGARRRRPLLRLGAVAVLGVWAGTQWHHTTTRHDALAVMLPTGPSAPDTWAVDASQGTRTQAQPLPAQPFPEQKRPPCSGAQVERGGGCWYRVQPEPSKLKPGEVCSSELYQSGKECFLPVLDAGSRPVARNP